MRDECTPTDDVMQDMVEVQRVASNPRNNLHDDIHVKETP